MVRPPSLPPKKKSSPQQTTLRARASRLLARREYSRRELQQRLERHGDDAAEIAALLDEFAERGWLSDARYAEAVVRRRKSHYAKRAIQQELKQAGVSAETSDRALAGLDTDDLGAACALWRRKFSRAPVDQKEKARQVRFLQARGYSLSIALRVLKQASDSGGNDDA